MRAQIPLILRQGNDYFVGVISGSSAIMKVVPRWKEVFERPEVVVEGGDHPSHDEPQNYCRRIDQFRYEPLFLGGLLRTHKIDFLEAARDTFSHRISSPDDMIELIPMREFSD